MKLSVTFTGNDALRAIKFIQADDERIARESAEAKAAARIFDTGDMRRRVLLCLPQPSKQHIRNAVRASSTGVHEAVRELLASGEMVRDRDGRQYVRAGLGGTK